MKVLYITGEVRIPVKDHRLSLFEIIVNGLRTLTICRKSSILDVWLGSEHISMHKANLHIKKRL